MGDNYNYRGFSTKGQLGPAISSGVNGFLTQLQNAQKMALLQQSGALDALKASYENPYRQPSQLDYLKAASNPYNTLNMMQMMQGAGQMPQTMTPFPGNQTQAPMQAQAPQGTQATNNQEKINALIEELYAIRKAKGESNAQ